MNINFPKGFTDFEDFLYFKIPLGILGDKNRPKPVDSAKYTVGKASHYL